MSQYVVVEGRDWILVDAGYPRYVSALEGALTGVGLSLSGLAGVVVTHHHVDHAGMAEHLRQVTGAPVFVHRDDVDRVAGQRPSRPPQGFYGQAWRPSMVRYLAHTVAYGGARYVPVARVHQLHEDIRLDLPANPRVVHTPGHTAGHCCVVLDERGVLCAGDAMVNFDYASGQAGVSQHRFNEDRARALASLDRLDDVDADVVLFGHGEPWRQGTPRALETVRERAALAEGPGG